MVSRASRTTAEHISNFNNINDEGDGKSSENLITKSFYRRKNYLLILLLSVFQIFWTNFSNQEKRGMHSRLEGAKQNFIPSTFQMMKTNLSGQRKFPSWNPIVSAQTQKTQQLQMKTSHRSLLSMGMTIIMALFPPNTPQMSVKIIHRMKPGVWRLLILSSQKRPQVSHIKHFCLYLRCLTAA